MELSEETLTHLHAFPSTTAQALELYLTQGIQPGSFLEGILSNNLKMACGSADRWNRSLIYDYVHFLYNYVPAICWGSPENYQQWMEAHK